VSKKVEITADLADKLLLICAKTQHFEELKAISIAIQAPVSKEPVVLVAVEKSKRGRKPKANTSADAKAKKAEYMRARRAKKVEEIQGV
jgi:hypothetical protein